MTTLQIVSDLHLDKMMVHDCACAFDELISPSADVIAIAGDVCPAYHPLFAIFIAWCAANFKWVYVIHGNHELHYTSKRRTTLGDNIAQIQAVCDLHPNVIYLNNRVHVFQGVCFIGSTLWSFVPDKNKREVEASMPDYDMIFMTRRQRLTVDDTNRAYLENKAFLQTAINEAAERGCRPVVITHHPPSTAYTSHPRFEGSSTSCAFASDIDIAIEPKSVQLWVSGHTHYNFASCAAGFPLVSNQRGPYPRSLYGYSPSQIHTVV